MKKEYFDVVNTKNRIIGQALRSDCHIKGLWHRASDAVVINYKGEILSQKRAPDKDLCPNLWGGVGEHHKHGEDYLAAMLRGLKEELKFKTDKNRLEEIALFKNINDPRPGQKDREFIDLFLLRDSGPFPVDAKESSANGFYRIKKILSWNLKHKLNPPFFLDIKLYIKYRKHQGILFKQFVKSKDSLWILWKNKIIYRSQKKGILPLIEIINKEPHNLKYRLIFDKVVGRAAALLLVYAGVAEIHTPLISLEAIKLFKKYQIYHHYIKSVSRILNVDKSDSCPFEKMAAGKTPFKFYQAVKTKF